MALKISLRGFVTALLPLLSLTVQGALLPLLSLTVQGALGGIECESLGQEKCSFAVSSTGKRCVLEKHLKTYVCMTSEIEAYKLKDHIETDECTNACGLDRMSLGISSDSLLDSKFTNKLCSTDCYQYCPNVVDLYFKLLAAEGIFLPKLCEAKGANAKRLMADG